MGVFVKGDIVVVPFPFSDMRGYKRRPALVLADSGGNDLVLCQITSQNVKDNFAVAVTPNDTYDNLSVASNVRPNKIFTVEKSIILYKVGALTSGKLTLVMNKLSELFELA